MEKKKYVWIFIGGAAIGIIAAILYGMKGKEKNEEAEASVITATYVPYGENEYIYVSDEAGVFTVTAPPEMYDILDKNGNKIALNQLVKGNKVKIYGDGIMLESYPGQYPGASRIEVIEEGSPSDADQYQEIVDALYTEPDPAEPPTLQVDYTTDLAAVTVLANRGGYEWVYMDKDGLSNAVVADSPHVLDWGELLIDISLTEPTDLVLAFSEKPEDVEVIRYDSSLTGKGQDVPEGEKIEVTKKDDQLVLEAVEGGYVYEVVGIWENGRATYGFLTVNNK
ncbi:MAG TPA: hypothetical protein DCZ40_03920 [Lachnospiraceae bacterium]|nr:hypothetical protein [Lachnospiraceae bacterium]